MTDCFTPISRLALTRNHKAPYRQAPGLSMAFTCRVTAQWSFFTDGDGFKPLPGKIPEKGGYLDFLPEALGYRLVDPARVFILDLPVMR